MSAAYEKLGLFYLGRRFDLTSRTRLPDPVLYDSKDLLTHAICVGMTGSGKTGLGIAFIEEAAIDGIPVLAIDPKGDLANLLLTFPDLSPADFAPWIDRNEAARREQTVAALAAATARRWRDGLAEWDQDGDRIARLRAAAEMRVFTPGSRAGSPLAVLGSLGGVRHETGEDAQNRIASTAGGLLGLVGLSEAQIHDREHALLSAILSSRSTEAATDLAWLVGQIQRPSFDRIGVLDLETFYPARDRQQLALKFNSVLAAPGFDVWSAGQPLDIGSLLFTPEGRPRIAIISIAHLGDAERMLVVSMVLSALVQWTRHQSGTGSLRALVYMDEVFGYLPPVGNPSSKLPLLTLLKQARAYGVGLMLATQNPVDLDYKALSNAGTWLLGKLQTERDKDRVLSGLEGAAGGLDRHTLDQTLSKLASRVFLMHNVHEAEPVVFETRWVLSYLRGPLGRDGLSRLVAEPTPAPVTERPRTHMAAGEASSKPTVPAGIREYFLPADTDPPLRFRPVLYGAARIHYSDARRGIDVVRSLQAATPFSDGAIPVDWDAGDDDVAAPDELIDAKQARPGSYDRPAAAALDPKRYVEWSREFADWIVRARPLALWFVPSLKLLSEPGESERDFRIRAQQAAHEARDSSVESLRTRFAPKIARLDEKVRKARETVKGEQRQVQQQTLQTAVSLGATMLGALIGRKSVSLSTLGRATTAARGVGRSVKETQDVERARERLREAEAEFAALESELERAVAALEHTSALPPLQVVEIKARRTSVDVRLVALAWQPVAD